MDRRPLRNRTLRQLRRRCQAAVEGLRLPDPLDLAALGAQMAADHGDRRPVLLRPVDTLAGPWGLWVATATTHFVYFAAATSRLHQAHIILHELWHLWRHRHRLARVQELPELERWQRRLPDLDPEAVARALGRIRLAYTPEDEAEAEVGATLILQRVGQHLPPAAPPSPPGGLLRLAAVVRPTGWASCHCDPTRTPDPDDQATRCRRRRAVPAVGS